MGSNLLKSYFVVVLTNWIGPRQESVGIRFTAVLTNWACWRHCPLEALLISAVRVISTWVSLQHCVHVLVTHRRVCSKPVTYGIQIKQDVTASLNVAHLLQCNVTIFQHNPRASWHVFSHLGTSLKSTSRNKLGACICNHLRTAVSTSSYFGICQDERHAWLFSAIMVKNTLQCNECVTFGKLNNKDVHNQKFHGVWMQRDSLGIIPVSGR